MWLIIPILVYSLLYLYVRHVYTYWQRKGFPSERPGIQWSFLKQVYKREFQHVSAVCEAYERGTHVHVAGVRATAADAAGAAGGRGKSDNVTEIYGIYFSFRPVLLVRDLAVARTILEQWHVHFNDGKWDYMRGYRKVNLLERLAPVFSVGRMAEMFRNVEKIADYMVKHQADAIAKGALEMDVPAVVRIYAINIIGNLIYGLDENNFEQPDAAFYSYIKKSRSGNGTFHSYSLDHLPKMSSLTYRLRDIIKESIEAREDGGCIRKDVLQLLVKFRNGNELEAKGDKLIWHIDNVFEREKVLSIKETSKIAEALLNMGLDAIDSTIVLTLYEVLRKPEVLSKLLQEVDKIGQDKREVKQGEQVKLLFADLEKLKYLNACVDETLRLHPPVPIIERVCRKNFNIPDTRYMISEGRTVMIPLVALQRDERYYKDPMSYEPARFAGGSKKPDSSNGRSSMSYGLGAATCVAQNFSKLVIKMALVKLLQNFQLTYDPAEILEIVQQPTPIIKSRQGFKVKLKNRPIKPQFYL